MRVLVVCADRGVPLDGPSGASAHLRGIVRALADDGHHVTLAAPDRPPRAWPRGLRTFGARADRRATLRAAQRRGPYDLVWERHGWPFGAPAGGILEVNAPLALERGGSRREQGAEHRALRAASQVVAVSRWLATWAVAEVGCDPHRVRHVPNGTAAAVGNRVEARERLGLAGPVVGFLGSMRPWHGADRLPAFLDALGPGWTGLAVGDGPTTPAPHPRLRHVGQVGDDEVADLVAAMDVAVAPYRSNAPPWFSPLKVFAYRAQGVPVVSADVGEMAELVGDEGAVVPTDDPGAWADAIRAAVERERRPVLRSWRDVVHEVLAGAPVLSPRG